VTEEKTPHKPKRKKRRIKKGIRILHNPPNGLKARRENALRSAIHYLEVAESAEQFERMGTPQDYLHVAILGALASLRRIVPE